MAVSRRLIPTPLGTARVQPTVVNGRSYTLSAGGTLDVASLADAQILVANQWCIDCGMSGTTANRPTNTVAGLTGASPVDPLFVGMQYLDTSLNAHITWDGVSWRNIFTGATA
jgi:hypothetical protein